MMISLQLDSGVPLYEQLRNQIVVGIATGELAREEKLPTVRQLADELGINTMTVNKAYSLLKQQGYIVIDRRHGAKVSPPKPHNPEPSPQLEEELQLIIAQAAIQGIDRSGFQELCSRIFSKMTFPQS
ncbi:DNA-binding transcriptional regulator YhcF, GntR family [Paenibacillus sp. cl141a]|uniref:GntR family transcriptional regulator n=1 Tax=Paenibacillus sp. cl141a TaxID=1761877 RepID=UPI0008D4B72E|nr:GntR family transcriptional regulator [Paenibacillus sp. cl141a]SEL53124.1 DNA-binding transcriptional regulator YhcF, GntR family [Paenibacillus sp. cl141a]